MIAWLSLLPWTCLQAYRFFKSIPRAEADQSTSSLNSRPARLSVGIDTSVRELVLIELGNQTTSASQLSPSILQTDLDRTDDKLHTSPCEVVHEKSEHNYVKIVRETKVSCSDNLKAYRLKIIDRENP
jgi:hypothetical protein